MNESILFPKQHTRSCALKLEVKIEHIFFRHYTIIVMSAGAGTPKLMKPVCKYLRRSIHACPSPNCDGDCYHFVDINTDPRKTVCKKYVGGCCLDLDCKDVHCAVSALYYAENVVTIPVNTIVKNSVWMEVNDLCCMNARYYYNIVNPMNETLEFMICRGVRSIIESYIGHKWHNTHITKNKIMNDNYGFCHMVNGIIMNCHCCLDPKYAEYIAVKKVGDEYAMVICCGECYNPESSSIAKAAKAMYNIGLIDFQVFPIDELRNGIRTENYVLKFNIDKHLEVFESKSSV